MRNTASENEILVSVRNVSDPTRSLAYSQGFLRFFLGGTTGSTPCSKAAVRTFARSISRYFCSFPAILFSAAQCPSECHAPARRMRKSYCGPVRRSNHMNFSGKSSSGPSDRLLVTCFKALVPSGRTFFHDRGKQAFSVPALGKRGCRH